MQVTNLQQQRLIVEQLRREANIKRINVGQASEDLKVGAPEIIKPQEEKRGPGGG